MKKILLLISIIALSFTAGYQIGGNNADDLQINQTQNETNCPYLNNKSSASSENECPYLKSENNSESKCPYNSGKTKKIGTELEKLKSI